MIVVGCYPNFVPARPGEPSPIAALGGLLSGWLHPAVALHLLPFNPNCGDSGFSSTAWDEVDPALGSWSDIAALATRRYVLVDGIYNHVGVGHPLFLQFLKNPRAHADLFYAYAGVLHLPAPCSPRGGSVLREWQIQGDRWLLWQTFNDRRPFLSEGIVNAYLAEVGKKGEEDRRGEDFRMKVAAAARGDQRSLPYSIIRQGVDRRDPIAVNVVDRAARYFGLALNSVITLLNPATIILAGGVVAELPFLRESAISYARRFSWEQAWNTTQFRIGRDGRDHQVIGAAILAHKRLTA